MFYFLFSIQVVSYSKLGSDTLFAIKSHSNKKLIIIRWNKLLSDNRVEKVKKIKVENRKQEE